MSTRLLGAAWVATFSLLLAVNLHAGSIIGEVKFVDAPPALPVVKVTKDQDY
jgi:hypothetical protein